MTVVLIAPVPPPSGGMALQARQLERLLQRDGIRVDLFASNFPLPHPLHVLQQVPLLRTCLRALLMPFLLGRRVRHADVLHILAASGLYFFLVVYPAALVGRAYGKRVVLNYRGGAAQPFFRRWGWLAAPAFRLVTVITAPSSFLATMIEKRFGVAVTIVSNVLDSSAFPYRHRSVFRPRLLVTRQLEKIYDVASVLAAFAEVQARYPDASLWIAGGGSQEDHLRRSVAERSLRNVQFLGEVPHAELPPIYDECDIYVNASRVDNFPGSLLEASAAGLAIVSTNAGGIPHIYQNGHSAILVEAGDWKGLADGVDKILTSPSFASNMSRTAAAIARTCNWPDVRKALFTAYGVSLDRLAPPADLKGVTCNAG